MTKQLGYTVVTAFFALAMAGGGIADIVGAAPVAEPLAALGYPTYFAMILGAWKLLGVTAVVVPGFPLLKEWAYAGFFFALTGASASHLLAGEPIVTAIPPLFMLALGLGSYALRPASRRVVIEDGRLVGTAA